MSKHVPMKSIRPVYIDYNGFRERLDEMLDLRKVGTTTRLVKHTILAI